MLNLSELVGACALLQHHHFIEARLPLLRRKPLLYQILLIEVPTIGLRLLSKLLHHVLVLVHQCRQELGA